MIKAVLLDMGGVLIDTRGVSSLPGDRLDYRGRRAMLALLRARGSRNLRLDDLESELFGPWHRDYVGRYERMREASWEPHLERLRSKFGGEAEDGELLSTWFAPYAETLTAIEGAGEALGELQAANYRLGLVSNVPLPGDLYLRQMERWELVEPLESIRFSYDADSRKPSPRMLLEVLQELGVPAQEAVMVGDRRGSDVAAGRAAATRTVWIRSEFSSGPAADATIDSIAQLPRLLADWAQDSQ